jgi:hypothetical protein
MKTTSQEAESPISQQVAAAKSDQLRTAKQLASAKFLRTKLPSVVVVGIGKKLIGSEESTIDCVRIYVSEKPRSDEIAPASLIPPEILGVPTDVIRIGRRRFKPLAGQSVAPAGRPARPGSSIGYPFIPAHEAEHGEGDTLAGHDQDAGHGAHASNLNTLISGTLGAVVQDKKGKLYVLGTNHVLAVNGRVPKGLEIVSPAPGDANENTKPTVIATSTERFIPLDHNGENRVDCGLASPLAASVDPSFPEELRLDRADPVRRPEVGQQVVIINKAGKRITGKIVDVSADFFVDYSFGTFRFVDQVLIEAKQGEFAENGDSGVIVVTNPPGTKAGQAVAMVFASAGDLTAACPLPEVLEALSEELKTETLELVTKAPTPGASGSQQAQKTK